MPSTARIGNNQVNAVIAIILVNLVKAFADLQVPVQLVDETCLRAACICSRCCRRMSRLCRETMRAGALATRVLLPVKKGDPAWLSVWPVRPVWSVLPVLIVCITAPFAHHELLLLLAKRLVRGYIPDRG